MLENEVSEEYYKENFVEGYFYHKFMNIDFIDKKQSVELGIVKQRININLN